MIETEFSVIDVRLMIVEDEDCRVSRCVDGGRVRLRGRGFCCALGLC